MRFQSRLRFFGPFVFMTPARISSSPHEPIVAERITFMAAMWHGLCVKPGDAEQNREHEPSK